MRAAAMRKTKQNKDEKEVEEPPDFLVTHHQKRHGDRGFSTLRKPSHDQPERILPLSRDKYSLNLVPPALVCAELLFVGLINRTRSGVVIQQRSIPPLNADQLATTDTTIVDNSLKDPLCQER